MHLQKIIFFLSTLICFLSRGYVQSKPETDLIVYSYDRPMQLYAFLESVQTYVSGLANVFVIVRTSDNAYKTGYEIVQKDFPRTQFIYQTSPYLDLRTITLECFFKTDHPYILFGVDDIIIKDTIDLAQCAVALSQTNAHGFFFRLGKNLDYCYGNNAQQQLPPFNKMSEDVYLWKFCEGEHDWRYPNNLDFTLYKKADLEYAIINSDYKTPYTLESQLMAYADMNKYGLCFQSSKIVNFPLNVVQNEWPNPCAQSHTPQHLLELFNKGLKIDIKKLYQLQNRSAHIADASLITFISRTPYTDEKLIVIVTPSYNNKQWWQWNISSLVNQDYHNYYIIITDDCSPDGTGDDIEQYIIHNQLQHKVKLIKNKERRGALHNLYTMIHSCPDDAIIATFDGDDAAPDSQVLKRLNSIYSHHDVWLTYGQFIEHPSKIQGWGSPMPDHIIKNNTFRQHPDLPSHLRTFNAWLFKSIKLEDLLYNGDFYKMTWDYAMMFPMIEMAGEHHMCIQDQIMYIYNNANTISDHKISRQLQAHLAQVIRARKPYQPLSQIPTHKTFVHERADMIMFAEETDPIIVNQCLESIEKNITGIDTIYVLYLYLQATSVAYSKLKEKYRSIRFVPIDENRDSFKGILLGIYNHILKNNYVVFALPNTIIEKPINVIDCIQALETTQAYAFCLKLSKEHPYKPIPTYMPLLEIKEDLCAWYYANANDIWACANNVDMALYRRDTPSIPFIIENHWMYSWTHFVGWWSHEGNLNKVGLCFKSRKIKSI